MNEPALRSEKRSFIVAGALSLQKVQQKYWWRIVKKMKPGTKKVESFCHTRNILYWNFLSFKCRISTNGDYERCNVTERCSFKKNVRLEIVHNYSYFFFSRVLRLRRCDVAERCSFRNNVAMITSPSRVHSCKEMFKVPTTRKTFW